MPNQPNQAIGLIEPLHFNAYAQLVLSPALLWHFRQNVPTNQNRSYITIIILQALLNMQQHTEAAALLCAQRHFTAAAAETHVFAVLHGSHTY